MNTPKLYPLDLFRLHQDEAAAFVQRFSTDFTALNLDSSTEPDFNLLLQPSSAKCSHESCGSLRKVS